VSLTRFCPPSFFLPFMVTVRNNVVANSLFAFELDGDGIGGPCLL
jgi:hypothetical protein